MTFPYRLDFKNGNPTFVQWQKQNAGKIDELLFEFGAILFENASVITPHDLESFICNTGSKLFGHNGEHEYVNDSEVVQTPVFYPNQYKILWHNENSFHLRWPGKIAFACIQPSITGGETTLVDCRQVLNRMDSGVRKRFEEKEVTYIRRYVRGFGLSFEKTFGVKSKQEAEEFCKKNALEFTWHGDILETKAKRKAIVKHPITEQSCFVAQGHHWHSSMLKDDVKKALISVYGYDMLPREFTFGDDEKIDDSIMQELSGIYEELEFSRPWNKGDLIFLDNVLVAHARNPYEGERQLLVTLADPIRFQDNRLVFE